MNSAVQIPKTQQYIGFSFNRNYSKKKKNPDVKLLILTESIIESFNTNPKILTWFLSYLNMYRPFNILFYDIPNEDYLLDILKLFNNFNVGKISHESVLNASLNNYRCQRFLLYTTEVISIDDENVERVQLQPNISLKEFVKIITQINSNDGQVNEFPRSS